MIAITIYPVHHPVFPSEILFFFQKLLRTLKFGKKKPAKKSSGKWNKTTFYTQIIAAVVKVLFYVVSEVHINSYVLTAPLLFDNRKWLLTHVIRVRILRILLHNDPLGKSLVTTRPIPTYITRGLPNVGKCLASFGKPRVMGYGIGRVVTSGLALKSTRPITTRHNSADSVPTSMAPITRGLPNGPITCLHSPTRNNSANFVVSPEVCRMEDMTIRHHSP